MKNMRSVIVENSGWFALHFVMALTVLMLATALWGGDGASQVQVGLASFGP